jgi:hypothetical protein
MWVHGTEWEHEQLVEHQNDWVPSEVQDVLFFCFYRIIYIIFIILKPMFSDPPSDEGHLLF